MEPVVLQNKMGIEAELHFSISILGQRETEVPMGRLSDLATVPSALVTKKSVVITDSPELDLENIPAPDQKEAKHE